MLILLLEDHKPVRDMLKMALLRDRHEVLEAGDVATAKNIIQNEEPDLAIVDWMLPDVSGVDFIRWLRRQKSMRNTPVLMLTAKTQEADTITGLDAGAHWNASAITPKISVNTWCTWARAKIFAIPSR